MITFTKPIVFFDLETTGVSVGTDRIVQIAIEKLFPDGSTESKSMLINPGMPIPKEASDIHGITDDMVKDAPTFARIAKSLKEKFDGSDIAGFNSDEFDIPLLQTEFDRCEIQFPNEGTFTVDMYTIEKFVNSHKLGETFKRYEGKELVNAHDATADVYATRVVFGHQVPKLFEMMKEAMEDFQGEINPESISKFFKGDKKRFDFAGKMYIKDGIVYWNFSDHMDTPVMEKANRGFLNWVLTKDFPPQTKKKIRELLSDELEKNKSNQIDLI
jgi:DNA polymerase III, epsilon subunit and related 3''-5'' exonucleases